MLLVGEHEEDGWIQSTFTLTYRVAWEQLLLAVYGAYRYFSDPEVLVDGKPVEIGAPEEILTIAEDRNIMLRGISTVITAPLMISFYNQAQFVNVSVAAVNDEFRDTDYEKYNKSMGQLMDSMEIMMHLPAPTAEEEPTVSDTPVEDAQPAVSDTPVAQAQAPAEEEPAVSDTSAAQEAAPDTDEVSAQVPACDEPPADEAQHADEQVSPLSRLSMELGIPQPPA